MSPVDATVSLDVEPYFKDPRVQAFIGRERPWWGTQFHPERFTAEEPDGRAFLEAFFRSAE